MTKPLDVLAHLMEGIADENEKAAVVRDIIPVTGPEWAEYVAKRPSDEDAERDRAIFAAYVDAAHAAARGEDQDPYMALPFVLTVIEQEAIKVLLQADAFKAAAAEQAINAAQMPPAAQLAVESAVDEMPAETLPEDPWDGTGDELPDRMPPPMPPGRPVHMMAAESAIEDDEQEAPPEQPAAVAEQAASPVPSMEEPAASPDPLPPPAPEPSEPPRKRVVMMMESGIDDDPSPTAAAPASDEHANARREAEEQERAARLAAEAEAAQKAEAAAKAEEERKARASREIESTEWISLRQLIEEVLVERERAPRKVRQAFDRTFVERLKHELATGLKDEWGIALAAKGRWYVEHALSGRRKAEPEWFDATYGAAPEPWKRPDDGHELWAHAKQTADQVFEALALDDGHLAEAIEAQIADLAKDGHLLEVGGWVSARSAIHLLTRLQAHAARQPEDEAAHGQAHAH